MASLALGPFQPSVKGRVWAFEFRFRFMCRRYRRRRARRWRQCIEPGHVHQEAYALMFATTAASSYVAGCFGDTAAILPLIVWSISMPKRLPCNMQSKRQNCSMTGGGDEKWMAAATARFNMKFVTTVEIEGTHLRMITYDENEAEPRHEENALVPFSVKDGAGHARGGNAAASKTPMEIDAVLKEVRQADET